MASLADPTVNDSVVNLHSDSSERIVGAGRGEEDRLDWLENQSHGRKSPSARGRGAFVGLSLLSAAGAAVGFLALAA